MRTIRTLTISCFYIYSRIHLCMHVLTRTQTYIHTNIHSHAHPQAALDALRAKRAAEENERRARERLGSRLESGLESRERLSTTRVRRGLGLAFGQGCERVSGQHWQEEHTREVLACMCVRDSVTHSLTHPLTCLLVRSPRDLKEAEEKAKAVRELQQFRRMQEQAKKASVAAADELNRQVCVWLCVRTCVCVCVCVSLVMCVCVCVCVILIYSLHVCVFVFLSVLGLGLWACILFSF